MNYSNHHIIPFFLLRDVWLKLANHLVSRKSSIQALSRYVWMMDTSNNRDKVMSWLKLVISYEQIDTTLGPDERTSADATRLQATLSWPIWNIVRGPKNRSDNDSDYNKLDDYSIGLTHEEALRMTAIRALFNHMMQLTSESISPDEFLRTCETIAPRLAGTRTIIPFRESMWTFDERSKTLPDGQKFGENG